MDEADGGWWATRANTVALVKRKRVKIWIQASIHSRNIKQVSKDPQGSCWLLTVIVKGVVAQRRSRHNKAALELELKPKWTDETRSRNQVWGHEQNHLVRLGQGQALNCSSTASTVDNDKVSAMLPACLLMQKVQDKHWEDSVLWKSLKLRLRVYLSVEQYVKHVKGKTIT